MIIPLEDLNCDYDIKAGKMHITYRIPNNAPAINYIIVYYIDPDNSLKDNRTFITSDKILVDGDPTKIEQRFLVVGINGSTSPDSTYEYQKELLENGKKVSCKGIRLGGKITYSLNINAGKVVYTLESEKEIPADCIYYCYYYKHKSSLVLKFPIPQKIQPGQPLHGHFFLPDTQNVEISSITFASSISALEFVKKQKKGFLSKFKSRIKTLWRK